MNRLEDRIRDYLAEHLELLETGLVLEGKEFRLSNPNGAGGRIDILARDRLGHFVVIEIKRSNQAARQTLNEVHKYTALFRQRHGLDASSIRIIIASTEWHELRLPLAEFVAYSQYDTKGFEIEASEEGYVRASKELDLKLNLTAESGSLISRCQAIYLFEDLKKREAFLLAIIEKIKCSGIDDYFLLRCDYRGINALVVYPHAVYLCFRSPLQAGNHSAAQRLVDEGRWEEGLDHPEENFLCAIESPVECQQDDYEIGYPEKLSRIAAEWDLSIANRFGCFNQGGSIFSNEELLKQAKASEGGSNLYFTRISSPQFRASWTSLREQVIPFFEGYPQWGSIVSKVLDEIEEVSPQSSVSISVYAPGNMLISLYALSLSGTTAWMPTLCIVVDDPIAKALRMVVGVLAWDGEILTMPFQELMKIVFGSCVEWAMLTSLNATDEMESEVMRLLHIKPVVAEWVFDASGETGPIELSMETEGMARIEPDLWRYKSILDFAIFHKEYLKSLENELDSSSTGLKNSILCAVNGKQI